MLSLLHATAPVTLKLSPPSHHYSPYSPLGKQATFTRALTDVGNSPSGDHPPAAICHLLDEVNSRATNVDRFLPILTRPAVVFSIDSDARTKCIDASPNSTTRHSNLAPGTKPCAIFPVHGPFDLLYCLQTGGFGSAWAAKDRHTGRLLCLKVFQSVQDLDVRRSVRTELNAFKRIVKSKRGERGKQFIMELSRSMQHGFDVFFAMELMTTDLGTYFSFKPERCKMHARRWTAQIALGIQSLHEMAIIHRDIKTENILIDSRENIRIIDFGLVYLGCSGKPPRAIEFLGTPSYMAPEVLRNKGLSSHLRTHYSIAVDWWALGCILFELESRDHQILFDTEDDVHAYVAWAKELGKLEQKFPSFEGIESVVVSLLEGLLQVEPSNRHLLADVEKHAYFLRCDGTTEFDNATARALQRPVRLELVPQISGDPPMKFIEAGKLATSNDWTNLKWALADG